MEDFLTIVHPISKNRISIFSSPGRNLLKSYLQTYKSGGEKYYPQRRRGLYHYGRREDRRARPSWRDIDCYPPDSWDCRKQNQPATAYRWGGSSQDKWWDDNAAKKHAERLAAANEFKIDDKVNYFDKKRKTPYHGKSGKIVKINNNGTYDIELIETNDNGDVLTMYNVKDGRDSAVTKNYIMRGGKSCQSDPERDCDIQDYLYNPNIKPTPTSFFNKHVLKEVEEKGYVLKGEQDYKKIIFFIENYVNKFREGKNKLFDVDGWEHYGPENLINNNNISVSTFFLKKPKDPKMPGPPSRTKKDLSLLAYPMFYFKKIGKLQIETRTDPLDFKSKYENLKDGNEILGKDKFVWQILMMNNDAYLNGGNRVIWHEKKINGMDLSELANREKNPFYGMKNFMFKEQLEDFEYDSSHRRSEAPLVPKRNKNPNISRS